MPHDLLPRRKTSPNVPDTKLVGQRGLGVSRATMPKCARRAHDRHRSGNRLCDNVALIESASCETLGARWKGYDEIPVALREDLANHRRNSLRENLAESSTRSILDDPDDVAHRISVRGEVTLIAKQRGKQTARRAPTVSGALKKLVPTRETPCAPSGEMESPLAPRADLGFVQPPRAHEATVGPQHRNEMFEKVGKRHPCYIAPTFGALPPPQRLLRSAPSVIPQHVVFLRWACHLEEPLESGWNDARIPRSVYRAGPAQIGERYLPLDDMEEFAQGQRIGDPPRSDLARPDPGVQLLARVGVVIPGCPPRIPPHEPLRAGVVGGRFDRLVGELDRFHRVPW